jgi:NAD(P)-dependent dehydrogenase (short-subunit alcohol dehydrogenase family)
MSIEKNILITGASRGIGQATARLAAQQGWNVGLNYNQSKNDAEDLANELKTMGIKVVCLQSDVSQQSQVERMFREFDEALGPIHALINNAGILASFLITEVNESNLGHLYGANVFSAYYCAREAVLRMSTAYGGSGGAIVNMSSVASRLGGLSGGSAYAGSKGALDSLTWPWLKRLELKVSE